MRVKRIEAVEAYIKQEGSVSMQHLCERFQVSMNTIRRDIDTLVQNGLVKKVYGGVVALGKEEDAAALRTRELMDFQVRNLECQDEKEQIGRTAAAFVNHGDTIFLDSGSTTLKMIPYLADKKNITVITYSIPALAELAQYSHIRAIGLPGTVLGRTASLVGHSTCEALRQFNCSKAFLGCTGLSLTRQLTNATFEEFEVKQVAMEQSKVRILLADHEKFNHAALMTYGTIGDLEYLITDVEPELAYLEYFRQYQVTLVLTTEEA